MKRMSPDEDYHILCLSDFGVYVESNSCDLGSLADI